MRRTSSDNIPKKRTGQYSSVSTSRLPARTVRPREEPLEPRQRVPGVAPADRVVERVDILRGVVADVLPNVRRAHAPARTRPLEELLQLGGEEPRIGIGLEEQPVDRVGIERDLALPGEGAREPRQGRRGILPDRGRQHQALARDLLKKIDAGGRRRGRQKRHGAVVAAFEQQADGAFQDRRAAPLLGQLREDRRQDLLLRLAPRLARRVLRKLLRRSAGRKTERRDHRPRPPERLAPAGRSSPLPRLDGHVDEVPRRLRAQNPRDVELHEPPRGKERAVEQRVRHRLDRRVLLEAQDLRVPFREPRGRFRRRLLHEELHVPGDQNHGWRLPEGRNHGLRKRLARHAPSLLRRHRSPDSS